MFKYIVLVSLFISTSFAADNLLCDGGNCTLIDNAGNMWRAEMAFTTNGNGDIFTLGDVASTDNIIGVNTSSNRTLIDNLGRRWRAAVQYTTDGNGNVIPIPTPSVGPSPVVDSFNTRTGSVIPQSSDYSSFFLSIANNLSDLANAATARINLGLGTAATQASSFFLQASNNLSDLASASTARTNLGLGSAATQASTFFLNVSNNLSDLANAATARSNLGLGTAATQNSTAFDSSGAAASAQSFAIQRANHTGTQLASTISDFISAVASAIGYTPENVANKATDLTSPDNIKYPSTLAMTAALALKEDAAALQADVQTIAKNNINGKEFWVSKAIGNDANDCSLLKPCATIQRGINVAEAVAAFYNQSIVHVAPASTSTSYTENLTFSQQGVNVMCNVHGGKSDACVVNGTVTINLTGTSGGTAYIAASNYIYLKGLIINGSGSTAITFSGSTFQRLFMSDMYVQANSAGGQALSMTNSGVSGSTPSTILAIDSAFENNSSSVATISVSAGRFWTFGTNSSISNGNASGQSITQPSASSIQCNLTTITGQIVVGDNTANATFNLSTVTSGANSCIATPSSPNTGIITFGSSTCNSTNTNSFTGSGIMAFAAGGARLSTSGDAVSTITQLVLPSFPQGELQVGAGAVTGTNVLLSMKGGHIKATQTTAPTAVVNANAGTGATCTLSNASDVAGTINLTTTATAPASGTQCTITFNKAYGVAPRCQLTPVSSGAILNEVASGVIPVKTTTTLAISFANSDITGHTYNWDYLCIETQ